MTPPIVVDFVPRYCTGTHSVHNSSAHTTYTMKLNLSYALLSLGLSTSTNAFVIRSGSTAHFSLKSSADYLDPLVSPSPTADDVVSSNPTVITLDPPSPTVNYAIDDVEARRRKVKESLFGLIGSKPLSQKAEYTDQILADPKTKELLKISTTGALIGGVRASNSIKVMLTSTENTYQGKPNTYFDLLRESSLENMAKQKEEAKEEETANTFAGVLNSFRVFIPPPVRNVLATTGVLPGDDYIPMRDLFTSPQVSFAYERGWRQGFAAAGFPGADKEYEMVREYFEPLKPDTVVDMSCATGLFTRRLAKGGDYARVIGCDYSDSMLSEARRRIESDDELKNGSGATKLDLVRCDVGDIPMASESISALHAGAAMHCWPDLDAALSEIYRVLKPGGRFFTSTFLAAYFAAVQAAGGRDINSQAFQYFTSVDMLRDLFLKAGFEQDKISIEVLGTSCVIIRAEK